MKRENLVFTMQQEIVTFFVLGINKSTKGRYLARVLKTHPGINEASFDFDQRLLEVTYEPQNIGVEDIKKLAYFKECVFLSDKDEIKKQIKFLKKQVLLAKIMQRGSIGWAIILLYAIFNEIMERPNEWIVYILFGLVSLLLIICYFLNKKLQKEMKIVRNI